MASHPHDGNPEKHRTRKTLNDQVLIKVLIDFSKSHCGCVTIGVGEGTEIVGYRNS